MKKIAFILFLSLCMFACKSEEKKEKPSEKAPIEVAKKEKDWVINISLKTNKSDDFKLMMNNIEIDEFQKKNIHIIEKMEPTTSFETITAKFGPNISKNFVILFGNKEEKEISIQSIEIIYGGNILSVGSENLSEYFNYNEFIQEDELGVLKTIKKGNRHNPAMFLKGKGFELLMK